VGPDDAGEETVSDRLEDDASPEDARLQKLWIAADRRKWRSLAVVPATRDISSLDVANALAEIAWLYSGEPTVVVDLRDTGLRMVEYGLRQIDVHAKGGERVLVALSAIGHNPATIPLAAATDFAVLLVRLGETTFSSAERTIEEIGRSKFLGTLLVARREDRKAPKRAPKPASSSTRLAPADPAPLTLNAPTPAAAAAAPAEAASKLPPASKRAKADSDGGVA
jgi:hypothetical protein